MEARHDLCREVSEAGPDTGQIADGAANEITRPDGALLRELGCQCARWNTNGGQAPQNIGHKAQKCGWCEIALDPRHNEDASGATTVNVLLAKGRRRAICKDSPLFLSTLRPRAQTRHVGRPLPLDAREARIAHGAKLSRLVFHACPGVRQVQLGRNPECAEDVTARCRVEPNAGHQPIPVRLPAR